MSKEAFKNLRLIKVNLLGINEWIQQIKSRSSAWDEHNMWVKWLNKNNIFKDTGKSNYWNHFIVLYRCINTLYNIVDNKRHL